MELPGVFNLRSGPIDEDIKITKDTASLCCSVLRVVSDIFRLPALSAAFTADDLIQLADDILDLIESPTLPVPNDGKIRALALWVLSNGHFPVASLASRRTQLMRSLNESIEHGDSDLVVSDSLRALGNLLQAHSSILLQVHCMILPSVLNQLASDSELVRTEAAHALGSFAFAALSHDTDAHRMSEGPLRRSLQTFIDAATSKQSMISEDVKNLVASFTRSLGPGDTPTRTLVWRQVIIASIIATLGSEVFTHKASLKLIIKTLGQIKQRKLQVLRLMHALVWRCLVWAYAELQRRDVPGHSRISPAKVRDGALELIKQEQRDGIGAALISTLLCSPPLNRTQGDSAHAKHQDVTEAVAVLRKMASDRASVRAEARAILSRLTSAIGSAPTPPTTPATDGRSLGEGIVVKELFDGTILRVDVERLSTMLPELVPFSVEKIRPLTEAEIVGSWDALVEIWKILVKEDVLASQGGLSPQHDLLGPWQALLLVLAQLTQEHRHLTASAECAVRVAGICRDILEWQDSAPSKHPDESASRVNQLRFVLMMWKIARNVFNASWLAAAAEPILRAVLQRTYDLANREISDAWAELSSALVLSGASDLLLRLAVGDEAQQEMELKRHLWSVLAKSWAYSEVKPDWKVTVSLVTLPIGGFDLCDDGLSVWDDLLRAAVVSADSARTTSDQVLETIAARFDEHNERLSRHPRIAISMLSHLKMDDDEMIPREFLRLIDDFLCDLYASSQEHLYPALETFRALSTLFQSCSLSTIVSLISAISGLCIWIRDEEEVVPEENYNDVIMHLYQTALARLTDYHFTANSLGAIAPFLASAFKRIPQDALGPLAFKEFWESIRHTLTPQARYSLKIQAGPKSQSRFLWGPLPSDISYDSGSQSSPSHKTMYVKITT
ncbi:uncharacterized protein B0H18DRAFT_1113630 [Fomitopsis serialis]|uniref:uncharacterized protein n=1 Tax=Fomitopsis serialis TaxID=139415 RepID=UPI002008099C|nr:uncharacterized protein B0H18DRAFT_1113630 [Neoantrodia serialis]KAH9936203.1 hypothetical protein B0H18DRAFT_1113630 [Neoantrodia serialis]